MFSKEGFEGLKDLEFEYMPAMPNAEEVNLLEAQQYANKLKEEQLQEKGLDIKQLKKHKGESLDKPWLFRPVDMGEEKEIEEKDLPRFEKSFEQFKV